MVAVCQWDEPSEENYLWRRMQTSEQQSQRARKNILQKTMTFAKRAMALTASSKPTKQETFDAFMKAINEYNNFGAACSNDLIRISQDHADQLFGFMASWFQWC